jgi:hypothetical protein
MLSSRRRVLFRRLVHLHLLAQRYVGILSHACVLSSRQREQKATPATSTYVSNEVDIFLRLVSRREMPKRIYLCGGVDGITFCGACKIIGASILRLLGFD